ncbi:MAG: alpha/beta hydrolase-fold protein [Bacteroidota bacterium]
MHKNLKVILFICFVSQVNAQQLHYAEKQMTIHSKILQEDRKIQLYFPSYSPKASMVFYVLDGNWNYELVKGTLSHWVRWELIPDVVIVAIDNMGTRTRDMTPTNDEAKFPGSGGASQFLKFLAQELQPAIQKEFDHASYSVLFGHSFGGLFSLYALKEQPDLFDAYIVASPSVWWKDRYMYGTYHFDELQYKPFVYSTAGTNDRENTQANEDYIAWLKQEKLDQRLELYADVTEGEDHFSNVPITLHNGLKHLIAKEKWSNQLISAYDKNGLNAIERETQTLSNELGIRFVFPTDALLKKSLVLHREKRTGDAIDLLRWIHDEQPHSYQPPYYLGYLLSIQNDHVRAMRYYQKALDIGGMPERMRIVIEDEIGVLSQPLRLLKAFSTDEVETSIAFTPDETMVFVSRHSGEWGKRDNPPSKIHQYRKQGSEWKYLGLSPFSSKSTDDKDSDIFISYDGNEAFFTSTRAYPGKEGGSADIWKSTKTKSGWSEPRPVKEANSAGYEASPVTDAAGNLYFSSIREGGHGLGDFYMAKRNKDGSYQAPEILSGQINAASGEWNLLVSPEADWIIFESSGRDEGLSNYGDLYLSQKTRNGWSKPVHLTFINSTGSDLNVRYLPNSDKLVMISSTRLESKDTSVFEIDKTVLDQYFITSLK